MKYLSSILSSNSKRFCRNVYIYIYISHYKKCFLVTGNSRWVIMNRRLYGRCPITSRGVPIILRSHHNWCFLRFLVLETFGASLWLILLNFWLISLAVTFPIVISLTCWNLQPHNNGLIPVARGLIINLTQFVKIFLKYLIQIQFNSNS